VALTKKHKRWPRLPLLLCAAIIAVSSCAAPILAESSQTYVAGNFWPDVDAIEHGRALRLWMAFYNKEADEAAGETPLTGDMSFEDIRGGFIALYANQFAQLAPTVSITEDELELYLVDSQFQLALPLSDFTGTLKDLWVMATGDMTTGESERAPVDRTFMNRENPLGVTKQAMIAYVRRIANVTNSNVSGSDIEETAKEWLENQAYQGEPLTGFILMIAPKDQTAPPQELEVRTPLNIEQASRKKPAGHAAQPIEGIAASSSMITQARIKSGVFVDLRLYNGNAQLSFKQSTGKSDAGRCLDMVVYGTPNSLKNLRLGMSKAAKEELTGLGIQELHIRVCTPGGVKPYAEYWLTVPLA
jgi:hypothetical protein